MTSKVSKASFFPNLRGILGFEKRWPPVFPSPGATRLHSFRDFGRPVFFPPPLNGPWSLGWISVSGRATTRRVARARGESFIHLPHAGREPANPGRKGREGATCGQARLHHEISSSCTCFVRVHPPPCVGRFHDSLPGANRSFSVLGRSARLNWQDATPIVNSSISKRSSVLNQLVWVGSSIVVT